MFVSVVLLCNVLIITPVLAAPTDVPFPTTDVQYPTTDVQYPTTDMQYPTTDVPFPTTDVQYPTTDMQFPTTSVAVETSAATVEPTADCPVCLQIVNVAMHHISDKNPTLPELQKKLQQECADLEQRDGPAAVQHCVYIVNTNIAELYDDIENKRLTPYKTCQDIQQC